MEGSSKRRIRLQVEQGFEVSRLEKQLLASAYEHAVPEARRTFAQKRSSTETLKACQGLHVSSLAQTGVL